MPSLLSINEAAVRRRVSGLLKDAITRTSYIPANATQDFKLWLSRMDMTKAEREAVERTIKEILSEQERRIRWIRMELDQEVFHKFGGNGNG